MKGRLSAFLVVGLLAASPAWAVYVDWTDWTSATNGLPGSARGNIGSIGVTYTGEVAWAQTNGGTNWWTEGTPAPYTGNFVIDNAPPPSDIIVLDQGYTVNTLTFDTPLVDPVMAFVSIGRSYLGVSYSFDAPFALLSEGQGWWGNGSWTQSDNSLTGYEAHGAIQFSGTLSSISWTNTPGENWHGFQVGSIGAAAPVPEPGTMILLGSGLLGLAGYGRKRKK